MFYTLCYTCKELCLLNSYVFPSKEVKKINNVFDDLLENRAFKESPWRTVATLSFLISLFQTHIQIKYLIAQKGVNTEYKGSFSLVKG